MKPILKPTVQNNKPIQQPIKKVNYALGKTNYILIAISFAIIVIGFLLMLGGSSTDTTFNPDIFSTRRIAIGPTLSFIGFVCIVVAILYRPKQKPENQDTDK